MNLLSLFGNRVGQARESLFSFDARAAGIERCLGYISGANVNSANTDAGQFTIPTVQLTLPQLALLPGSNFVITRVWLNNASVSLTTATYAIWSGAGGTGTNLVATAALSSLTSATVNLSATIVAGAAATVFNQATVPSFYFRNITAQGAAATVDAYLFGIMLP